jgi:hypothetical protein
MKFFLMSNTGNTKDSYSYTHQLQYLTFYTQRIAHLNANGRFASGSSCLPNLHLEPVQVE